MSSAIAWLAAAVSSALCIFLWFRDVRRTMLERRRTVEFAEGQLRSNRRRAKEAGAGKDGAAVLERSVSIHRQAVDIYNHTLRKPWIYLPAIIMGFKMY